MHDLLLRDAAMTAAVLAFFAAAWFGWAQEHPRPGWRAPLTAGSVGGLLVAAAAGAVAGVNWDSGSVLDGRDAFGDYLVIVGVEFTTAAAGAVLLAVLRRARYIPVWICLVVGVHFFPMAGVLDNPALYGLAVLLTAAALLAPIAAARTRVPVSLATGVPAGTVLLVFALWAGGAAAL
ncbi:hypothetical protein [Streptomonospora wellingtoniae]|uniref:Uncharacterized protein n=1 Tax=Streptomonospora wellingtoniae TaxID=3075544 RepID=A0ABU2KQ75_9ACTN|nr:hypothetical protein [Streptomonospora sp. DSM 45055]MDT0301442.1 hypothetical protein [Streptomonospora sp. DSM 45055]